ncbi:MAG TPA: pyrroloquinoline quinone-dependent dehydrogenase [Gammaproteobacteria bacterium]|nr:pyrroloquinoline quinone-dependent dehydrogenase [Gammaproteobacteria bacterium]
MRAIALCGLMILSVGLLLTGCGGGEPKVAPATSVGWANYGGDAGGTRYSQADQITPANVKDLKVAWTFRTGETGAGFPGDEWKSHMTFEATPILYDGTLYFTTSETNVVALDAVTGKLRWRFDSQVKKLWYSDAASRGVTLWVDDQTPADAVCHARIFAPTLDHRLLALNASTGELCQGFADHGILDLSQNINFTYKGGKYVNYLVTSPPVVIDGKVIVGSSIGDDRLVDSERGTVRAFDARTGKLVWSWDPIPRDPSNPVYKEWTPQAAQTTGGANAWPPLSADPARHLVFIPTTSPSADYFGGERPGDNRWANSVITLNADTGKLVWGYQLVHHDLWDYDTVSQPSLVDLIHAGSKVPALIEATKTGMLFTFNRETGLPIFPIVEKPVPQDGAPGELPSKTQPFPVAPPPLVRQGPVTADDAWGVTFWDKDKCRRLIKQYRSEGIFTPPGIKTTVEQPGNAGGVEWGGIAFDPVHQLAVVNTMNLPWLDALIPRDQLKSEADSGEYNGWDFNRMLGTPYGRRRKVFLSPLGIPCVKPPWGQLAAVDMQTGKIKWQVPLGNALLNHWNLGVPNIGGPIVTAGGLAFIAATMDDDIRAFDINTGKVLWQYKLPAGGQATPMTYAINGRQYLVIVAGGHGDGFGKRGDYVVAFALP